VELAHGGTLFLDEVEAMSAKMQVSLYGLEEGRVTRWGRISVAVDVRVIAAPMRMSRKPSGKNASASTLHRLAVFPIMLPPLRERTEDLPVLIRHLLDDLGFSQMQPTARSAHAPGRYAWPGMCGAQKCAAARAYLAPGTAITRRVASGDQQAVAVYRLPHRTALCATRSGR